MMAFPSPFLWTDRRGSAAVELALVAPMLIILSFGAMEVGKYFMDEHAVSKAVRDGARFAARQPFAGYVGCAMPSAVETATKDITRTGEIGGTTARIPGWQDSDITVSLNCDSGGSYSNAGIYRGSADGAPVVTVSASVQYRSILSYIGFDFSTATLNAQSEAAVTGI
ncbi:pilus assembly protein [Parasphingopyxis sp. CP4]|uniref:TadE/TadG family type IV pilus assembly protein n=1 Tax=Parasphingopyxis sp. CP4 TaxID=2724527 RepID=UPI0015A09D0E|nr:TadE/TadG family type IV pilus assembly protein [Parasphingopyxis sp. CP4]QLC22445.1 pilus assembly protein [Parasphingopyxis sp. CP4]